MSLATLPSLDQSEAKQLSDTHRKMANIFDSSIPSMRNTVIGDGNCNNIAVSCLPDGAPNPILPHLQKSGLTNF